MKSKLPTTKSPVQEQETQSLEKLHHSRVHILRHQAQRRSEDKRLQAAELMLCYPTEPQKTGSQPYN